MEPNTRAPAILPLISDNASVLPPDPAPVVAEGRGLNSPGKSAPASPYHPFGKSASAPIDIVTRTDHRIDNIDGSPRLFAVRGRVYRAEVALGARGATSTSLVHADWRTIAHVQSIIPIIDVQNSQRDGTGVLRFDYTINILSSELRGPTGTMTPGSRVRDTVVCVRLAVFDVADNVIALSEPIEIVAKDHTVRRRVDRIVNGPRTVRVKRAAPADNDNDSSVSVKCAAPADNDSDSSVSVKRAAPADNDSDSSVSGDENTTEQRKRACVAGPAGPQVNDLPETHNRLLSRVDEMAETMDSMSDAMDEMSSTIKSLSAGLLEQQELIRELHAAVGELAEEGSQGAWSAFTANHVDGQHPTIAKWLGKKITSSTAL